MTRAKRRNKKKKTFNYLYWTPRLLATIFTISMTLFSANVFNNGYNTNALILFFIHLTPVYVLIIVTITAWYRELLGGWIFVMLGFFYASFAYQVTEFTSITLLSGMSLVIGILFLLDHHHRRVHVDRIKEIIRKDNHEKYNYNKYHPTRHITKKNILHRKNKNIHKRIP